MVDVLPQTLVRAFTVIIEQPENAENGITYRNGQLLDQVAWMNNKHHLVLHEGEKREGRDSAFYVAGNSPMRISPTLWHPTYKVGALIALFVPSIAYEGTAVTADKCSVHPCAYLKQGTLPIGEYCPSCGSRLSGRIHPPGVNVLVWEYLHESGVVVLGHGVVPVNQGPTMEVRLLYMPIETGIMVQRAYTTPDLPNLSRKIRWDGETLSFVEFSSQANPIRETVFTS